MKYIFNLGDYDQNVEAFKVAVTLFNKKYGYPNGQGTDTYSDMYIHPDGIQIAMDINNIGDDQLIQDGDLVEKLDAIWEEGSFDTKISRDVNIKPEDPIK